MTQSISNTPPIAPIHHPGPSGETLAPTGQNAGAPLRVNYDAQSSGRVNFDQSGIGKPSTPSGRPDGDTRTAEQIFKNNPALKDVIKQDGPFANNLQDNLKQKVGDWSLDNDNPNSRADAAFNLAEVVNSIDSNKNTKRQNPSDMNDGRLQGFGQFGRVSPNSEAQQLKAFSEKGYGVLQ